MNRDTREKWFALYGWLTEWCRRHATMAIIPACGIDRLRWIYSHYPPDWIICWYKGSPGHRAFVGFNDWEPMLVYGKLPGLQMHDYFYAQPEFQTNEHPCPKPLEWATWLLGKRLSQEVLPLMLPL